MKARYWILILILIPTILILGGITCYFSVTKQIEVTSTIDYKYVDTGTDIIFVPSDGGVGIPVTIKNFMFVMDNGDEVEVSKGNFVKYDVGDSFTYKKRVWR